MRKYYYLIISILLFHLHGYSQNLTLSEQELVNIVKLYHPVAKQAALLIEQSKAQLIESRGAFDPKLETELSQKDFSSVEYYHYRSAEIKVPTWYGIEVYTGIENITGDRLNPQITKGSSHYAGISFSLLQNLVIDKRRAYLKQAQIMVSQSEEEQKIILNDLLYDALTHYWEWAQLHYELQVVDSALLNARLRLDFTKNTVNVGERAAIDSTEAWTQYQYFESLHIDLTNQLRAAILKLSTFTWTTDALPYDLPYSIKPSLEPEQITPASVSYQQEEYYTGDALLSHPELTVYNYKLNYLDVYKKLAFQQLLPKLDVKYNQLGKNYTINESVFQPLLRNNYQYGVQFSMPLRLSDGRGEYKLAKLKIQQTNYDIDLKRRSLINKIKQYYFALTQTQKQLSVQQSMYTNQLLLLQGEETRFEQGESSLFLVNSREQKAIETQQKLVALQAKLYKQLAALKWSAGLLHTE